MFLVLRNEEWLTGGSFGLVNIPRPDFLVFSTAKQLPFYYFTLACFGLSAGFMWWIVRSPWGRVLKAIREDESAAESLGKNAFSYRLQSFVIGSAVMGLGGALNASFIGYISPEDFMPILTFQIWSMLIVGGSGNNKGAVLGAVLMWAVWTLSGSAAQVLLPATMQVKGGATQIILIGLVLMLVLVLRPRGLIGEEATVSQGAHVETGGGKP